MIYHWIVVLALGLGGTAALAQALPDPTRPSVGMPDEAADPARPSVPSLQSVMLPRYGKPSAFINGALVTIGSRVGNAEVVKITEIEVVLKGSGGVHTLKMTPEVEKKPAFKMTPEVVKKPSLMQKPLAARAG